MTIIRCTDIPGLNDHMRTTGHQVLAAETRHYLDGHDETEILWVPDNTPIGQHELPF